MRKVMFALALVLGAGLFGQGAEAAPIQVPAFGGAHVQQVQFYRPGWHGHRYWRHYRHYEWRRRHFWHRHYFGHYRHF